MILRRFVPPRGWFDGEPIFAEGYDPDDRALLTATTIMWLSDTGRLRLYFAPIEDGV